MTDYGLNPKFHTELQDAVSTIVKGERHTMEHDIAAMKLATFVDIFVLNRRDIAEPEFSGLPVPEVDPMEDYDTWNDKNIVLRARVGNGNY